MNDEQETTEVTEPEETTAADEAVTADAVAEAAEAIAGAAHDDTTTGDADGGADAASSGATSDDLAALKAERDQALDKALRTQAELDNYRKRTAREAEQFARYQMLPMIRDLLPAIDNLQRTMQAAGQTTNVDDLVKGVEMILTQFDQVFASHSAKPIDAVGQPFDPNLHEAVQQMPSEEHEPGTVIQDLERGYVLHDRVIRPTKVIVASAPPAAAESTDDGSDE